MSRSVHPPTSSDIGFGRLSQPWRQAVSSDEPNPMSIPTFPSHQGWRKSGAMQGCSANTRKTKMCAGRLPPSRPTMTPAPRDCQHTTSCGTAASRSWRCLEHQGGGGRQLDARRWAAARAQGPTASHGCKPITGGNRDDKSKNDGEKQRKIGRMQRKEALER